MHGFQGFFDHWFFPAHKTDSEVVLFIIHRIVILVQERERKIMKPNRVLIGFIVMAGLFVAAGRAQGQAIQDEQIKAYIEMMRKDIRAERNTIVDQAMGLDPAGKAKFWGIYDKYSNEIKALWDERLANIMRYADNYDKMTDTIADEMALKAIDIRSKRLAIQKKYYDQMKAVLGARVGVRFLQIESMLDDILDIQIGSEIPLME